MHAPPSRGRRHAAYAALFLAPAVAMYTVFVMYPLIGSGRLSLLEADTIGEHFVGLANYQTLFGDPYFSNAYVRALGHTLQWFLVHVVVHLTIALLLALLLTSRNLLGRSVWRVLIFAPTVLSVVIVGFIWQLILSPLWGVAPEILGVFGLEDFFEPWLGREGSALLVLSLMSAWQWMGIPVLLFSAALLGIPEDLMDAAQTDGAGRLRVFLSIQLPMILPTVGMITLLTFIGSMKTFDLIYTVEGPQAGPNFSTEMIGTLFYRTFFGGFADTPNLEMGSTIGTTTLFLMAVVVAGYFALAQRRLQRYEP